MPGGGLRGAARGSGQPGQHRADYRGRSHSFPVSIAASPARSAGGRVFLGDRSAGRSAAASWWPEDRHRRPGPVGRYADHLGVPTLHQHSINTPRAGYWAAPSPYGETAGNPVFCRVFCIVAVAGESGQNASRQTHNPLVGGSNPPAPTSANPGRSWASGHRTVCCGQSLRGHGPDDGPGRGHG